MKIKKVQKPKNKAVDATQKEVQKDKRVFVRSGRHNKIEKLQHLPELGACGIDVRLYWP